MSLHAKLFVALAVGYAFSPVDLIPDPVLGYLDDLVLVVPLGVALAVRMIPEEVLSESRQRAREMAERGERPVSRVAAAVIVALWWALAAPAAYAATRMIRGLSNLGDGSRSSAFRRRGAKHSRKRGSIRKSDPEGRLLWTTLTP